LFFVLSKTLGLLLLPSTLLILPGALGLVFLFTRYRAVGRKLLAGSVTALIVCGFLPLGNLLLVPLETRFPAWQPSGRDPDGIVVLGGAINPTISALHGTAVFNADVDRILSAAMLARRYPKSRIVYSGGSGELLSDAREADFVAPIFESLGVGADRLVFERNSRNTWENALFAKAVAMPKADERWLLVTSAFHMPRAMGAFRAADFRVEPYPVDWKTRGWPSLLRISTSFSGGLSALDFSTREWIGLVAYRITGKTDALFPGPGSS
jgi:uncharacterized SAM-binding protein YcdF (DUF218 family)